MEAGSTAVLRVKRKLGAEPAEALVLACKRLRSSAVELETPKTSPEDLERAAENNIFQLVATVRSQEEPVQPLLRAALRPSQGSQQRIRHHLRASAREIRQEGRYRVVSSHRSSEIPSDSLESEDASGTPKAADDASFQLLDLVHEEDAEVAAAAAISCKKSDPDVILCNCVELIREGLNVSQYGPSSGHQKEQKDDFVYDIYYLERATPRWIENILSVQPYSHEWELVNDDQQPEDIYDDEDDENSENNWRNEYPEEENSDEDSRGSDNYSSVSEEDRDNSRPPMWSKYPLDVQKEFDYDSPHDLDSD
ncbi:PREDICTED: probable RNA polymerase II nuclear localization protein SLC7A6OS [Capra hircus]|uniref:Probable RNA polymerase II nuclear localization protein SLC7A6OS n=1 Tax=Capra hircus TaxID=9925 RepID=A0A452FPJ7_CAPHI|nr:PREDICTED: probable RNA polymerase II nuclear localization protein SLC7A6OS [Capra hircus]KAJ1072717.1 hypothetical protein K5549_011943 [Capra hircus]